MVITSQRDASSVGKARIEVTPPSDPKVIRLQLRTSPDEPYQTETERTVMTPLVSETTFLTDAGLTVPGSEGQFRVYAQTATGNEAGSVTLYIERPE